MGALLDTPFGRVRVMPTSAGRIFVDGLARDVNTPDSPNYSLGIVVNRVALSVRLDLHKWSDGAWHTGREDDPHAGYHGLSATRTHWTRASDMDASWAARRKLADTLVPLVVEWAESEAGRALLAQAGESDRQARAQRKREEITELRAKLAQAESELAEILGGAGGEA